MTRIAPALTAGCVALAAFGAFAAAPASAASFDCARATAADERTICASRSLNDRDVKLDTLHDLVRHLVPMGSRDAIMRDQAAWLKQRLQCGANRQCIAASYDRRIAAIRKIIDDRVVKQGPF